MRVVVMMESPVSVEMSKKYPQSEFSFTDWDYAMSTHMEAEYERAAH